MAAFSDYRRDRNPDGRRREAAPTPADPQRLRGAGARARPEGRRPNCRHWVKVRMAQEDAPGHFRGLSGVDRRHPPADSLLSGPRRGHETPTGHGGATSSLRPGSLRLARSARLSRFMK
jgi:hypothetical protein